MINGYEAHCRKAPTADIPVTPENGRALACRLQPRRFVCDVTRSIRRKKDPSLLTGLTVGRPARHIGCRMAARG